MNELNEILNVASPALSCDDHRMHCMLFKKLNIDHFEKKTVLNVLIKLLLWAGRALVFNLQGFFGAYFIDDIGIFSIENSIFFSPNFQDNIPNS